MSNKLSWLLIWSLLFPCLLNSAEGYTEIIEYVCPEDTYVYTFCPPEPGWQNPNFDEGAWQMGNAPFANISSGDPGEFSYNTYWPEGSVIYLRVRFNLDEPRTLTAFIKIDNRFDMWVNGTYIWGAAAEGFTWKWQYIFSIGSGVFRPGENVVTIKAEDYGGMSAFDMKLVPAREPNDITLRFGNIAPGGD